MNTDTSKKAQHKSFVEKARELGCDEDENRLNTMLKKIARHEPHKKKGKTPNGLDTPLGET